jgi:hypothetical protein
MQARSTDPLASTLNPLLMGKLVQLKYLQVLKALIFIVASLLPIVISTFDRKLGSAILLKSYSK